MFPQFLSLVLFSGVIASPISFTRRDNSTSTATPTPVSDSTVTSDFIRPIHFAQIAYCSTSQVTSANVDKIVSNVEILQTGGDDGLVPMYFIAHDPDAQSIVLAHQGTNAQNILSIGNDVQFIPEALNTTLFPNAPQGVEVHDGFQQTFARTSDGVLSGVKAALAAKNVSQVAVTGHSLGAAIATMGAVMLRQNLPASIAVSTVVFGLPRGGNQAWADFVNSAIGSDFTHITNQEDPVPTVPPRFLGFVQPQGEVHITGTDSQGNATGVVACLGQENEHCSEGNSIFEANISNHIGPYFQNISLSGSNCPLS